MIRRKSNQESPNSDVHGKTNELQNEDAVKEESILISRNNSTTSLEESFDMLKDVCSVGEGHVMSTDDTVSCERDGKRDSTSMCEEKEKISEIAKRGEQRNISDSIVTSDSKQILPSIDTSIGNQTLQFKSSSISNKKTGSSHSSLSLRPSMVSSSVIGNDSSWTMDETEKRNFPDNLGETICSSVHESSSSKDHLDDKNIGDTSSDNVCPADRHEFNSFLTVGHHLFSSSMTTDDSSMPTAENTPSDTASNQKKDSLHWWEEFSDTDWDTMKDTAQFLLEDKESSREPSSHHKNLPIIPPSPPSDYSSIKSLSSIASSESQHDSASVSIHSIFIPREFLCPLCKDIIVGAAILDCTCPMNTFCSSCLEEHILNDDKKCPSCNQNVTRAVSCHTLDVAILSAVKDIHVDLVKENDASIQQEDIVTFQRQFYKRLQSWRNHVLNRHKVASAERERQQEVLLSLLIQKEEEVFWEKMKQEENAKNNDDCSRVDEDLVTEQTNNPNIEQIHRTRIVDVAMVAAAAVVGMSLLRRH